MPHVTRRTNFHLLCPGSARVPRGTLECSRRDQLLKLAVCVMLAHLTRTRWTRLT